VYANEMGAKEDPTFPLVCSELIRRACACLDPVQ